jgi:hypothetical protein
LSCSLRQGGELVVGDVAEVHQVRAEAAAELSLREERVVELLPADEPTPDQHFSQLGHLPGQKIGSFLRAL